MASTSPSSRATPSAVSLVLFREGREEPIAEIPLDPDLHKTGDVWHIFVHGPELRHSLRLPRPRPLRAPRPAIASTSARSCSTPTPGPSAAASRWGQPDLPHGQANGRLTRRSRIVADDFDWEGDVPPATPMAQTVIYELHVRGYTRHPSSGVESPRHLPGAVREDPLSEGAGRDGGAADAGAGVRRTGARRTATRSPASCCAITGATRRCRSSRPRRRTRHAAGQQVREFKEMVKAFHKAGIEVILDVVYNHTCEGNENGPTRQLPRPGQRHLLHAGQGGPLLQLLRLRQHPQLQSSARPRSHPRQSDRAGSREMHVDGFRFDLAAILGRGANGKVLDDPPLIQHIAEHPLLAGTKLIAEAWDAAGLSQLGKFPAWGRWAELNGVLPRRRAPLHPRRRRRHRQRRQAHLRQPRPVRRRAAIPYHSVNFITCHDGFTLNDLVSYNASTTRPTARTTATAGTTTSAATAATRGRRTTASSTPCASGRCATSSRCC